MGFENLSLVNPQDLSGLLNNKMALGAYGAAFPGLQQQFQQGVSQMTQPQEEATAPMDKMAMFKMMAQGLQGLAPRQQQPQNNIQIMRDTNQFRYASNPQQQMANALRSRGQ